MAKRNKQTLPERFWVMDGWKVTFKNQLLAANNLLKVYEYQAILNALELKSSQWICSLWAKNLVEIIIREQETLVKEREKLEKEFKKEIEQKEENPILSPEVIVKPFASNKNKLNKLD